MQKVVVILFFMLFAGICAAQNIDKKLQSQIESIIKGFNGDIGIYVKNLKTGKEVCLHADSSFPTASVIKIPILIGIENAIQKGLLHKDSLYTYKDSMLYEGEDILGSFKDGEKIALKKKIMIMLTTSDNTASLWLQKMAGTGSSINQYLEQLGFQQTKVNSRTLGRRDFWEIYGWGQTTPREIALIFESIYRHKIFTPSICDDMMRMMSRNFWDEVALYKITHTIAVMSKNGAVDGSRNEVMIVNAPDQPYMLSIFTKNNQDISWQNDNEAWVLTRKISKLLWNYFEPKFKK